MRELRKHKARWNWKFDFTLHAVAGYVRVNILDCTMHRCRRLNYRCCVHTHLSGSKRRAIHCVQRTASGRRKRRKRISLGRSRRELEIRCLPSFGRHRRHPYFNGRRWRRNGGRRRENTVIKHLFLSAQYASVLVSQGRISQSEECLVRSAEHIGRAAYTQLASSRKTRRAERAHHAEHGTVTRSVQRNAEARRQWSIHTTQSVQRVPWNAEITVEPSTHLAP